LTSSSIKKSIKKVVKISKILQNTQIRFKAILKRFKRLSCFAGIIPLKIGDVKKLNKHQAFRGGKNKIFIP